jgi:hypothetical protein
MDDLVKRVAKLIRDEYTSPKAKDPSRYIASLVVEMVLRDLEGGEEEDFCYDIG